MTITCCILLIGTNGDFTFVDEPYKTKLTIWLKRQASLSNSIKTQTTNISQKLKR